MSSYPQYLCLASSKGIQNGTSLFAVVAGADMREEWIQEHKPVSQRFTIIVVSTIVAVALIFTLAFLVAFGSNFYKGKKRDAY